MYDPRWLNKGPGLEELAGEVVGMPKSGRTAIIIPAHDDPEEMLAHLSALEKQSTSDFDVILVLSPSFPEERVCGTRPYGVVKILLRDNLGVAGYYAGEIYALSKGYRSIIFADSDSLPVSQDLVEKLSAYAASSESRVFLPSMRSADSMPRRSHSMHWYGAMNRSVLEKTGLTYLPMFFGGEDEEMEQRIMSVGAEFEDVTDLFMDHPLSKPISLPSGLARTLYDLRNRGLLLYHRSSYSRTPLFYAFNSISYMDRADRASRRLGMGLGAIRDMAMWDLSSHYSRMEGLSLPYPESSLDEALSSGKNVVVIGCDEDKDRIPGCGRFESAMLESLRPLDHFFGLIPIAAGCDTLIISVDWKQRFCLPSMLAPNVFLRVGNKTYAVQRGRGVLSRYAGFALSCAVMASLAVAYLPLSFLSWLRVRKSKIGYGLEKRA